jgi:putative hydrolase of the HAD superfamily
VLLAAREAVCISLDVIEVRRGILVEDTAANLRAAKQLGMKTVLVSPTAQAPTYVDVLIKSVLELPRLGLTK